MKLRLRFRMNGLTRHFHRAQIPHSGVSGR